MKNLAKRRPASTVQIAPAPVPALTLAQAVHQYEASLHEIEAARRSLRVARERSRDALAVLHRTAAGTATAQEGTAWLATSSEPAPAHHAAVRMPFKR